MATILQDGAAEGSGVLMYTACYFSVMTLRSQDITELPFKDEEPAWLYYFRRNRRGYSKGD